MLRNELERQKKALGQEVALLHKEKNTLHDRGKCRIVTASIADIHNLLIRRVVDQNEGDGVGFGLALMFVLFFI